MIKNNETFFLSSQTIQYIFVEGKIDYWFYRNYIESHFKKKWNKDFHITRCTKDFNLDLKAMNFFEYNHDIKKEFHDIKDKINLNKKRVLSAIDCIERKKRNKLKCLGIVDRDVLDYDTDDTKSQYKELIKYKRILISDCADLETDLIMCQPSIFYNSFSLANKNVLVNNLIKTDYLIGLFISTIDKFVEMNHEYINIEKNDLFFYIIKALKNKVSFNLDVLNFDSNGNLDFKTLTNKLFDSDNYDIAGYAKDYFDYLIQITYNKKTIYNLISQDVEERKKILKLCNGHHLSTFYKSIFPEDFDKMKRILYERGFKEFSSEKEFDQDKSFEYFIATQSFKMYDNYDTNTSIGKELSNLFKKKVI